LGFEERFDLHQVERASDIVRDGRRAEKEIERETDRDRE
jgi:hypothetical protein